jgi:hypothetical protein
VAVEAATGYTEVVGPMASPAGQAEIFSRAPVAATSCSGTLGLMTTALDLVRTTAMASLGGIHTRGASPSNRTPVKCGLLRQCEQEALATQSVRPTWVCRLGVPSQVADAVAFHGHPGNSD